MSTSVHASDKEMKTINPEEEYIDIDQYRKLIRNFIDLRRYDTALFWAEKVVKLSRNDPRDIYWQAQCMFLLKEYHRAAHIIKLRGLEKTHIMCHYLAVESLLQAKEYQEALDILNSIDANDLTNSAIQAQEDDMFLDQFGFDKTMRNEILASICFLKGKVLESLDNRKMAMDYYVQALQTSVYCTEALDALVQHEMLMAWEERELMQHLPIKQQCSSPDAKIVESLYESKLKKYYNSVFPLTNNEQTPIGNVGPLLSIRQRYEKLSTENINKTRKQNKISSGSVVGGVERGGALFDNLSIGGGGGSTSRLLTPTPQNFMSPANKILNDIRNTPTYSIHSSLSRLSSLHETNKSFNQTSLFKNETTKLTSDHCIKFKTCQELLETSVDMLVAKAEKHFYNCEYNKSLNVLDEVLRSDPYHSKCLIIQIGCLAEMKEFNKLFYVAHKLVDLYPDQAISWYAVGCYYDVIGKSDPARRYLMKATSLDRLFGPAWLAYGHSFARENEHDQAMAAYFKATQLMRGCHLPLLYIGVECGLTKNLELAEKFFYQAMAIAPLDVFVLHELGVIKFEYEYYESAEEVFRMTLEMVEKLAIQNNESLSPRWEPLLNNLGHCCRKNRKYEEALEFHQRALILKPVTSQTYTAIGFVQALMWRLCDAIETLHKSLSIKRDDIFATTLQKYVIEDLMAEDSLMMDKVIGDTTSDDDDDVDEEREDDDDDDGGDDSDGETGVEKMKMKATKLEFTNLDRSRIKKFDSSNLDMSMDML